MYITSFVAPINTYTFHISFELIKNKIRNKKKTQKNTVFCLRRNRQNGAYTPFYLLTFCGNYFLSLSLWFSTNFVCGWNANSSVVKQKKKIKINTESIKSIKENLFNARLRKISDKAWWRGGVVDDNFHRWNLFYLNFYFNARKAKFSAIQIFNVSQLLLHAYIHTYIPTYIHTYTHIRLIWFSLRFCVLQERTENIINYSLNVVPKLFGNWT